MAKYTESVSYMFLTLSVILLCTQINRVTSVDGRLFFCAFMNPATTIPNPGIQEMHMSGIQDTLVRVTVLPLNYSYLYSLNATNMWSKTLTIYPDLAGPPGTKLPVSVIVASQKDISVQCSKAEDSTTGGYLAMPITEASTDYYVGSYTPRGPSTSVSIAAADYTCVTVYKENGTSSIRELDISLDPGQVYHIQAADDWTGRHVISKKPIAVFGGLNCAYISKDAPSVTYCDHIIEQLAPTPLLGQFFILSSFVGRRPERGFQVRVVATNAVSTTTIVKYATYDVTGTGTGTATVGAPVVFGTGIKVLSGQFVELSIGNGNPNPVICVISCSANCSVFQYGESYDMTPGVTESGVKPDAYMITAPDVSQHYTNDMTFSTSKLYSAAGNQSIENVNGLTVIVKQSDLSGMQLNGQNLQSSLKSGTVQVATLPLTAVSSFPGASGDTYSVVVGQLPAPGFYKLTNTNANAKYTCFVYGYAGSDSPSGSSAYGYLAGFKYDTTYFPPVTYGPWFNFVGPVGDAPIAVTPSPSTGGGNPAVTPTEYPSYESIWEARFYIVKPQRADLRTKNCSEAYHRYYLEERFAPMYQKIQSMAATQCQSGMVVNMTNLLYYSEYSDGLIRFRLSIAGQGAVTLNDILDCLGTLTDYLSIIKNWVPVDYVDETSFLRPDAYYNRGCDLLHMKAPNFESFYYGWNCPYLGGVLGASHGASVKASMGFLALLSMVASIMVQLR